MKSQRSNFVIGLVIVAVFASLLFAVAESMRQKQKQSQALSTFDPYRMQNLRSSSKDHTSDGALSDDEARAFLEKLKKEGNLPPGFALEDEAFENRNIQLVENPTQEQIRAYLDEIGRAAVATDRIEVSGCMPEPVIARFSVKQPVTWINNDTRERQLFIAGEKVSIAAQSEVTRVLSFASGTGAYNYDCDQHFSVGTVIVN